MAISILNKFIAFVSGEEKEVVQINLDDQQIDKVLNDGKTLFDKVSPGEVDDVVQNVGKKKHLIKFLTEPPNLFDKTAILDDYFMNSSGGLIANSTYAVSDFIPVEELSEYICNKSIRFYTYFDENQNWMSGGSDNILYSPNIINTPSGVAYIRITVFGTDVNELQFEKGNVITPYASFGPTFEIGRLITPTETEMFEQSKNLFNKYKVADESFINWTNGKVNLSSEYSASDFIKVTPNTTYVHSNFGIQYYAWYDVNRIYISGTNSGDGTYVAPLDAEYLRVTIRKKNLETAQLEEGTSATSYVEPFKLKDMYINQSNINKWEGLKWATLGDSITAGLEWQPDVYANHSLVLENDGVGGATIVNNGVTSMSEGTRISAMPFDADLISVMGGTNDWAQSLPLGVEDSTDDTTFYGAVNSIIEQLLTKYPTKRIFFMTTPYGEMPSRVTGETWSDALTNTQGLTPKDYADAIINRCKAYNIPYCDIYYEAGINSFNVVDFMNDDGNYIHCNSLGAKRYSQLLIDFINKL